MKIAIAHWQGRVSPVFDVADRLFLITIEDSREVHRESLRLASRDPFERARKLAERGVDVLLCGAVSSALEKALTAAGIRVLGFLGGELESIVTAFLDGQLNDGRIAACGPQRTAAPFRKAPRCGKRARTSGSCPRHTEINRHRKANHHENRNQCSRPFHRGSGRPSLRALCLFFDHRHRHSRIRGDRKLQQEPERRRRDRGGPAGRRPRRHSRSHRQVRAQCREGALGRWNQHCRRL